MLSDIYDGVIARRLGIATAPLRVMDSRADAWFFLWVGAGAWFAAPEVVRTYWLPISVEIMLQAAAYSYDLIRYRRITSLHAYSAKIWGVTLYLAAVGLLALHSGVLIWLAFAAGLASAADAMAIKLILPGWQHDILSFRHALFLRHASEANAAGE